MEFGYIQDNLSRIRETIAAACAACGRREEEITLVGVTKTVPAPAINAAIRFGLTHIGENRVQEFLSKQPDLLLDQTAVHLIGHLQTNKVNKIVGQVDMIESIEMMNKGLLNTASMITHIGGLNSVVNTVMNLPKIPGGKKLIYTNIDLPLTAIADFEKLGETDALFKNLNEICKRHNMLWNAEAEKYLLANAKAI